MTPDRQKVLLPLLRGVFEVKGDRECGTYILKSRLGKATTTLRVGLADEQSGADIVITNMTTLPDTEKNKGYGTSAVRCLIACAMKVGVKNIQAVQVQLPSERFWIRNGFEKLGNITNDFRLVM